jgi:succinate dehydrogenase / fumarate reductase cytochrome b subunit
MAEAAIGSPALKVDRSFVLRRLHSLSGIVPIGGYMIFHLFENMKATISPPAFNEMVKGIWALAPRPVFYAIEIGLLAIPILFHSFYGFYIWFTGKSNASQYGYKRNVLYTLQRWSGLVAFLYIAYHVYTLRVAPGLLRPEESNLTTWLEVHEAIIPGFATAIYLVGNVAAAFHLGNGIWGFCYSWGIAVGRAAQRTVALIGWAVFLGCTAMSVWIVWAFHTLPH